LKPKLFFRAQHNRDSPTIGCATHILTPCDKPGGFVALSRSA
jgi:hypothetical protein